MVDRRIMTMRVECVLSGTELDKLTSDLRVILLQPTIRTTIPFEKSGTA